jgi:hypothetical protein
MLRITIKPYMLSVVTLNVVILSVVAPNFSQARLEYTRVKTLIEYHSTCRLLRWLFEHLSHTYV